MENSKSFDVWMHEVDEVCKDVVGIGIEDLPDQDFQELYRAEFTPMETVKVAVGRSAFWEE